MAAKPQQRNRGNECRRGIGDAAKPLAPRPFGCQKEREPTEDESNGGERGHLRPGGPEALDRGQVERPACEHNEPEGADELPANAGDRDPCPARLSASPTRCQEPISPRVNKTRITRRKHTLFG